MKNYIILLLLFVSVQAVADVQKIVAIVNDDPITQIELDERTKLIAFFSNVSPEDYNQRAMIKKIAIENLIDEQLLSQQEKALGVKVDDTAIDNGISNIEENNKMPKGQLALMLREQNISYSSFRTKVKNDILKFRLASEVFAQDVNINNNDLETIALNQKVKDVDLMLKVLTTKDLSQKSYNNMLGISKKLKNCKKLQKTSYKAVATLDVVESKFSKLDAQTKNIVSALKVNANSGVVKIGDEFKIIMVCGRKVDNLSEKESNYFTNVLTNKKLGLKLKKYQEDLRKKAYIKIL